MKKALLLLVVLAVAAGITWSVVKNKETATRGWVELSGTIECEDVAVGSREGGRVQRVLVREGDTVEAGQTLVALEPDMQQRMLDEARGAVKMAAARLLMLKNGSTPEDIAAGRAAAAVLRSQYALVEEGTREEQIKAAMADYKAATAQFKNLKETYDRQVILRDKGVAPQQTVDNAAAAMRSAKERVNATKAMYEMAVNGARPEEKATAGSRLEEANAHLKRLEKGPRQEEIVQAEAALEQAQARERTLETRLDEMQVRAPGKSVVDVLDLYPGDLVAPGEEVARLVLSDRLWVNIFVPEDIVGFVKQGRKVTLTVDSFPEKSFTGTVSRVSQRAEFTPRNVQTPEGRATQVFRTKVIIRDPEHRLRAGMTAIVRLETK